MDKGIYSSSPVLLVDDDEMALLNYRAVLKSEGITDVTLCTDSRDVPVLMAEQQFDAVILDLRMPNISGEELLVLMNNQFPSVPVIIVTGVDDTDTVVECMKNGAFDFILKPTDPNRLLTSVKRTLQFKALQRENLSLKNRFLSPRLKHPEAFEDFDTCSDEMRSIFRYMEVIAGSPEPVLITGETGAGKELVARALHKLNPRGHDFVSINVAGLDDQLFSDTLFGHVKGAFTDAGMARRGLVEQAGNGVLFLDEIGSLSVSSQVKLLRLIQENEFFPVGSDIPKRSNARIIAATNKTIEELESNNGFRNDLYYRLCVHHIHVPPLRHRRDDIPLLLERFLEEAAADLGKNKPTVPKELAVLLSTYHFPGNIREMRSMVYDAVSKHSSRKMSMDSFKQTIHPEQNGLSLNSHGETENNGGDVSPLSFGERLPTLKEARELLVLEAMKRAENNQSIAARMLGITRQAINRRLKELKTKAEFQ